ncbi:MAG TPA: AAA family ATPase [Gemmatimonadaceae bacterium]|nr:AAA family ATPase [Gemmatimonadaceae bacterium]
MIEKFWGLDQRPFANTPDPAFTVRSPTFEEGFARLLYDVTELRAGLSLITGEVGCGKTMLAAALAERLAGTPQAPIALVTPRLTPVQLLRAVAGLLGLEGLPRARHALAEALAAHLAALHAAGRRPVLLVDEAQLAPKSLLEEIRLLTNYEDRTDKHLHVVLFGQPELRRRVASSPQLDQRISLRYHIEPLDADEVAAYVSHRLKVAGANGRRIFDGPALGALAERSGGVPRLVNNLATQALFVGAMRKAAAIDAALVADVADDRQ